MSVLIPPHISLYCDNKSTISSATNSVFDVQTKHIEVDCYVTHQEYIANKIFLPYIPPQSKWLMFSQGSNYSSISIFLV